MFQPNINDHKLEYVVSHAYPEQISPQHMDWNTNFTKLNVHKVSK